MEQCPGRDRSGSSAAAPKWPLPSLCIGADSAPILAKYRHSGATGENRSICCRFWRRVAVVMPPGYPESTDTSIRMLAPLEILGPLRFPPIAQEIDPTPATQETVLPAWGAKNEKT